MLLIAAAPRGMLRGRHLIVPAQPMLALKPAEPRVRPDFFAQCLVLAHLSRRSHRREEYNAIELCTSPNVTMYGFLHVLVPGARLTYVNAAMTESNSVHHKHETTRVAAMY